MREHITVDTNRLGMKQNVCGKTQCHTSNDDRLTDSIPSCISHGNCDTVDSTTLQLLYSVAGGGNTTTSPTSSIIISFITTAECSPHHLIAGHHCVTGNTPGEGDGGGCCGGHSDSRLAWS